MNVKCYCSRFRLKHVYVVSLTRNTVGRLCSHFTRRRPGPRQRSADVVLAGPSLCCNHRLHLETEAAGSRFLQVSLKLAVEHLWLLSEGLWSI